MDMLLAALRDFPETLARHFAIIPPQWRDWAPPNWEGVPSEPYTAIAQLCHVRDIETDGYHVRFRRMLDEEMPVLAGVDGDRLVTERRYAKADPADVIEAIRVARGATVELLQGLNEAQLERRGHFDGYGPVTVRGLMHYLCSHDQQHLAGLQWLAGKIASQAAT